MWGTWNEAVQDSADTSMLQKQKRTGGLSFPRNPYFDLVFLSTNGNEEMCETRGLTEDDAFVTTIDDKEVVEIKFLATTPGRGGGLPSRDRTYYLRQQ